jgi:hypothetical protein
LLKKLVFNIMLPEKCPAVQPEKAEKKAHENLMGPKFGCYWEKRFSAAAPVVVIPVIPVIVPAVIPAVVPAVVPAVIIPAVIVPAVIPAVIPAVLDPLPFIMLLLLSLLSGPFPLFPFRRASVTVLNLLSRTGLAGEHHLNVLRGSRETLQHGGLGVSESPGLSLSGPAEDRQGQNSQSKNGKSQIPDAIHLRTSLVCRRKLQFLLIDNPEKKIRSFCLSETL